MCEAVNWFSILAAGRGLTNEEQASVEFWLSIVSSALFVLVAGLLLLALLIRFIAKRSTRPCYWCMEFISKNETVCPRCGKSLEGVKPQEKSAPRGGISQ
jgi:hypothetical protein